MACGCTNNCGCNSGITIITKTGQTGPVGGLNIVQGVSSPPTVFGTTSYTDNSKFTFIYSGSDAVGTISSVWANVFMTGGIASGDIQLFDATHNLIVAFLTGITSTDTENLQELTIIQENIPTGRSFMYLRGRNSTLPGGGDGLNCSGLTIN